MAVDSTMMDQDFLCKLPAEDFYSDWTFTIKGRLSSLSVIVCKEYNSLKLTWAQEIYWKGIGRISQNPIPVSQNLGRRCPHLPSVCGATQSPSLPLSLSMASILLPLCGPVESVHLSSHVVQMWLVALIQAWLNPTSLVPAVSLPGILVPTSWERESGDPSGGQQWPRMGLIGLPPAYSRSSETVVLREGLLAIEALWRCELHHHSGTTVVSSCKGCLASLHGWFPIVACGSEKSVIPGLIWRENHLPSATSKTFASVKNPEPLKRLLVINCHILKHQVW